MNYQNSLDVLRGFETKRKRQFFSVIGDALCLIVYFAFVQINNCQLMCLKNYIHQLKDILFFRKGEETTLFIGEIDVQYLMYLMLLLHKHQHKIVCYLKQMIFQPPPIQTTRAPDSFKSCKSGGVLTITKGNRTFKGLTAQSY